SLRCCAGVKDECGRDCRGVRRSESVEYSSCASAESGVIDLAGFVGWAVVLAGGGGIGEPGLQNWGHGSRRHPILSELLREYSVQDYARGPFVSAGEAGMAAQRWGFLTWRPCTAHRCDPAMDVYRRRSQSSFAICGMWSRTG